MRCEPSLTYPGPSYFPFQLVEAVNEELLVKHIAASSTRHLSTRSAASAAATDSVAAPLPPRRLPATQASPPRTALGPPLPVALCVAVDCRKSQSVGVKKLRYALADEHKRLRERLTVRETPFHGGLSWNALF